MKVCMAGERRMIPLLACLSRLSRYLQGWPRKHRRLVFNLFSLPLFSTTTTGLSNRNSTKGWGGNKETQRRYCNTLINPKLLANNPKLLAQKQLAVM